MVNRDIERVRERYQPDKIKTIFLAEAPPADPSRFFYFIKNDGTHDALFLEVIRFLYSEYDRKNSVDAKEIRSVKKDLLKRFKSDGYYLLDALSESITLSPDKRIRRIKQGRNEISQRLRQIINDSSYDPRSSEVGIVLIKATVFDALFEYPCFDQKLPILNRGIKVPFPSHGHTTEFHSALRRIWEINNLK